MGCARTFSNAHSSNAHRRAHINGASSAPRRCRKRATLAPHVELHGVEDEGAESASDSNGDQAVDGDLDESVDGELEGYFDAAEEEEDTEPDGSPPCDEGVGAGPPRVTSAFIPDYRKASNKFANRSAPLPFARLQKLEAEEPEVVKTASLIYNAGLTRASKPARVCVKRLIYR